jgi:flagellar M-ring protein FliF
MEDAIARLRQFWDGLNLGQRLLYLGLPALVIIGGIAAIALTVGAPPVKAILFSKLETADAAKIVEQLEKEGVEYTLENDGKDIFVPATEAGRLRLKMAGKGLPRGSVGFELFDKQRLGITETGMKVDYQRALQGELSRTLESLDQVEKASVLLNIAPETSFMDRDARSTASITLALKSGALLAANQVDGVRHLISHAVARLDPQDVTITDGAGNPLGGKLDGEDAQALAGMELTDLQHRFQAKVERALEDKIRKVLEGHYGQGNVSPAVTVEVDFRRIHNESENYTPVVDDQGIEKRVEEKREKTSSKDEQNGGVPGTTSNIPGYLGISGDGGGSGNQSSKYETIVDYLVNKKVSLEDLPPGAVTKRSAAVAISTDTFDAAAKNSLEVLVASAIGADVKAGDVVNVQALAATPADTSALESSLAAQVRSQSMNRVIGWVISLLMLGLVALLMRSLVGAGGMREQLAFAGSDANLTGAFDLDQGPPEEDEHVLQRLDRLRDSQQAKMKTEIDRIIDTRPDMVAQLVRTWMLED